MDTTQSSATLSVPPDFTKPTSAYRVRAWIAMLGLILFLVGYLALASWFTYTAYRMIAGVFAGGEGAVAGFFAAIPAAFLAVFMWKALFFVRAGSEDCGVGVTDKDEPQLFAFLHQVADEVGAPRPHRVFLTPDVTAAVFYDLSVLNLLLPSKKNLVIGLGLVNSLGRTEFKAVLAHEFGHFAQRSMAVGRWVYIGEQITRHIINKRDALDGLLNLISSIDLRIAWIGWIMRLIVWSIRSTMESLFRLVILAHRALSREMEFQADLVAVSVSGSDAIVHALYKLQPADEDWDRAIGFANSQLGKERMVTDLYAIQSRVSELMRTILNEPLHGLVPRLPVSEASTHRIFTEQIAQPPKMWQTHPPNTEREENAKRVYLPGPIDESPAWNLFTEPQPLRERLTATLFESVKFKEQPKKLSTSEAIESLNREFSIESLSPRYRGVYLGRRTMLHAKTMDQAYGEPVQRDQIEETLQALYPESVGDAAQDLRTLSEELEHLEAVRDGVLESGGKVIHYRGEEVTRQQLSPLIDRVKAERDETLEMIEVHDRLCRSAHHAAARYVTQGWQEYLASLAQLVHYAEHCEADLTDAYSHTVATTNIATAGGRVSGGNLRRVMNSAGDLHSVMRRLDRQAEKVDLPVEIKKELEQESWRATLDKLELPPPDEANLGQWLGVLDSWVQPMMGCFRKLRQLSTAAMLRVERRVAESYSNSTSTETQPAPPPCVVPVDYRTRVRGSERKRQTKLDWWSRFTIAHGLVPSSLRFIVSASILGAVLFAGLHVGNATVVVYNGLTIPVNVAVNGRDINVFPGAHRDLSVGAQFSGQIVATSNDGRPIESFDVSLDKGFATYVYNVAAAAPLVKWTAVYGNRAEPPPQMLGFQRWGTSGVDHVFEDPPNRVETTNKDGATRSVLSGMAHLHPQQMLEFAASDEEKESAIRTRAMWCSPDNVFLAHWLHYASELDDIDEILRHRLGANPSDIAALREEQDQASEETRAVVLQRHRDMGAANPEDPNLQYIALRALPDGDEKDRLYLEATARWPDHSWLNYASGFVYAGQADWNRALEHYEFAARQRDATFVNAALNVARIRRMLAWQKEADLSDLMDCLELASMLAFETDEGLTQEQTVFRSIEQGQLESAYNLIETDKEQNSEVLVLVAASKDAPAEVQLEALELPMDQLGDPLKVIYLSVVAARNQKPFDPYLNRLDDEYTDANQSPSTALRALFRGEDLDDISAELDGLDIRARAAVMISTVLMRPGTPVVWSDTARKLLFNSERPYF